MLLHFFLVCEDRGNLSILTLFSKEIELLKNKFYYIQNSEYPVYEVKVHIQGMLTLKLFEIVVF